MKRLPAFLLAAMMLPALGVWSTAEAAKPKDTTCNNAAHPNTMHLNPSHDVPPAGGPGFKGRIFQIISPKVKFTGALIRDNKYFVCQYRVIKGGGDGALAEITAGSGSKRYHCTPASGFSVSSSGAKCNKSKPDQCHAICMR